MQSSLGSLFRTDLARRLHSRRIFFILVVRSADLQEQRSGTRRTSVAEEHLNIIIRVYRIETATPPIADTERGARDTFVIARVAA